MRPILVLMVVFACYCPVAGAQGSGSVEVSLEPSFAAPAMVGDTVVWEANVPDEAAGKYWYRFRVRAPGGDFRTAVDYGPEKLIQWTPSEHEGSYEVEVSVLNRETRQEARASRFYDVAPRVRVGEPAVIDSTIHPLVHVYSAPPCREGNRLRVEFESTPGDRTSTHTKPCAAGRSANFLLAGMRGGKEYSVWHVEETPAGVMTPSRPLKFTPPVSDLVFNEYQVRTAAPPLSSHRVLLQSTTLGGKATATDLEGNLLWYYRGTLNALTRPVDGGTFLGIFQQATADSSYQVVREFDLTGTTVRETNAARVSEQLKAMGKAEVSGFHHEADLLPGGRVVVLATTERMLTDVQGPGQVNVLGEMVVVLDRDFQVEWAWDSFDHIDPARGALLGETCTPGTGGCSPFYMSARANDWLHANSVRYTPDGNLVMSIRHLDWVIKIDYADGKGSGVILWRLGKDGDFTVESDDPDPWFSHQHDATILPGPEQFLTVFDNGNARYLNDRSVTSRGQMYKLDEQNRVAKLVYNVDLGVYASAVGSAQKLPNGNFHFNIGFIGAVASRSVETDGEGRTVFDIGANGAAYRTVRMRSLYAQ